MLPLAQNTVLYARDKGASLVVKVRPQDFINSTTGRSVTPKTIAEETTDPLSEYDPHSHSCMPYLRVNPWTRQIIGHDGRHRCQMLVDEKIDEVTVAIIFCTNSRPWVARGCPDSTSQYYDRYVDLRNPRRYNGRTSWSVADMPRTLDGQFIPQNRLTEWWDGMTMPTFIRKVVPLLLPAKGRVERYTPEDKYSDSRRKRLLAVLRRRL